MAKAKETSIESQGDGVRKYTKRIAYFYFVGDIVCCDRCPACETYARKQCRLTGAYIIDGRTPNCFCPLVDEETGEIEGNSY